MVPASQREHGTTGTDDERADLLAALAQQRYFLRYTVQDPDEEQARSTPTASALSLGGLVKHVAAGESMWVDFVLGGADAMPHGGGAHDADGAAVAWAAQFQLAEHETLAGALAAYEAVAERTEDVVRGLPALDASHPLPAAPWFPPGASWSARRALLHVLAETAQHAGHADVLRESLDGQRTMG